MSNRRRGPPTLPARAADLPRAGAQPLLSLRTRACRLPQLPSIACRSERVASALRAEATLSRNDRPATSGHLRRSACPVEWCDGRCGRFRVHLGEALPPARVAQRPAELTLRLRVGGGA